MPWPKQKDRDAFYGNPRGKNGQASEKWKAANLIYIKPPFKIYFAGKPCRVYVHKKCADSLARVYAAIWIASGKSQKTIDATGISKYAGCFNFRLSRNSNNLSSHSWGCAVDHDAENKPNGQSAKRFPAWIVKCFEAEGWINLKNDPMHFQAAIP